MRVLNSSTLVMVLFSLGVLTESWASLLQAFEVPVIVQEPAGIARKAEPVSGGIALPAGMFKPGTVKLALFDGTKPVPAQAGARENFVVANVPDAAQPLFFAVRSFDDSGNRSAISNVFKAE